MLGVSGSVPHGGFLTLLATGEVIVRSSGIVVVYTKKRVDSTAGLKMKRKRSSLSDSFKD